MKTPDVIETINIITSEDLSQFGTYDLFLYIDMLEPWIHSIPMTGRQRSNKQPIKVRI